MDDGGAPKVKSTSEGGVVAAHPPIPTLPVFVGPSTANESNRIKVALIPIGCWRVDDVRFDFDSSFVRPEVAEEVQELRRLREESKQVIMPATAVAPGVVIFAPLSIFGHADPVGSDDYNKPLSGRRAMAVYGMLTRDVALWEKLYSNPLGGDNWSRRSVQIMLTALGFQAAGKDGTNDADTRDAIRQFQAANGLSVDGIAGPKTRAKLFLAYMDLLCGKDFVLDQTDDFVAGTDPDGKGDYQGCSEFNPQMLFSKEEEDLFSKPENKEARNFENAPNRRVMVLLFRPGTKVQADKWPCPRAKEGTAGCKKRFWSDGEARRSTRLPSERREFEKTRDTFACRFYHRLASQSPCEAMLRGVHISVLLRSNSGAMPLANLPYRIAADRILEGVTDKEGLIQHDDVPAGDYTLELNGKEVETLVPTLPKHLSRRTLRIKDFFLIKDTDPDDLPLQDPNESIVARDERDEEGWKVVDNG